MTAPPSAVSTALNRQLQQRPEASPTTLALRRLVRKTAPMIGLSLLVIIIISAVFAPLLTPYDPAKLAPRDAMQPPSLEHPFGTDQFGRDQLTRILFGGQLSLQVGFLSAAIGCIIGIFLGATGGYAGGWIDEGIGRLMDVMLAFPGILLALAIVAVLGPSLTNLMIAVGVSSIPGFARLVRSETLSTKKKDYVLAARALGCKHVAIVWRHIIPNITASILVYVTLRVATAILASAALNYLGLGAKPPTPEWGLMLAESRDFIRRAWWLATFPGLSIMLLVISVNLLGDGLRDAFDPWLKGK
ncbi:MAG: ABC transporter permease [Chloroflexi bacterium]|nr:ABC transporter permease [Chloroflexota bacterium]